MKIGIFGGTFDPIHNGHIELIKNVKQNLDLDLVYFVPSYKTPDKLFKVELISPKHRYEMVKRTVNSLKLPWLKISDYEYKQKKTSYTYKTIEYFNKKKPNDTLYWIMGEDRYFDFSTWKNFEIIKNLAKIVIYRRSNEINEEISNDESVIYLKDSFFDISSTKILNEVRWDLIPEEAKTYIAKNKLYLKTLVFNVLKEKRYEHSVAVASHAKRLADRYKYKNVEKAWITGLVHDFFKLKSDKFLLDYKSKYGKNYPDVPIPALHGLVVALWLKEEYKWYDKEVFDALTSHTLGKSNASKLDKIIFVADKISTDRKGHKVGKLRKLAYKNLDFTYIKLIKNLIKKLKNKNIDPHINTIEAYRYYIDPKFLSTDLDFTLKKNKKTIINQ